MNRIAHAAVVVVLLPIAVGALAPTQAAQTAYPISGRWASAPGGGNPDCQRRPYMEFVGSRRFDFGTSSVPEYVALSVVPVDGSAFKIVELVFNGQVEGRMTYTLLLHDAGHATMQLQAGGGRIALKRCA